LGLVGVSKGRCVGVSKGVLGLVSSTRVSKGALGLVGVSKGVLGLVRVVHVRVHDQCARVKKRKG
jgi:hypothetical protein